MVLDAETDGESDAEHIVPSLVPDETRAPPPTPIKEFNAFEDIGKIQEAPSMSKALAALKDLHSTLYPQRNNGKGHKNMEGMQSMLSLYTDTRSMTYKKWAASSLQAAVTLLCGTYCAWILHQLVHPYILDHSILLLNPYGNWNEKMLVNKDLVQELGKEIMAAKIEKHGITKNISLSTAQCYLWEAKKGQYVDGHEGADVVWEHDKVFILKIEKLRHQMQIFDKDENPIDGVHSDGKHIVLWFHDESIFYVHDQRRKSWYHIAKAAKPYCKGERTSLMITDFFLANFRWLDAHRVMKPGKNRDGYFTTEVIILQANDEISAQKMPRNTPPIGKNWLVDITLCGDDGKLVYKPDGSYEKVKVQIKDATFNNAPQLLYFPDGHPWAGVFKGTAVILQEHGFTAEFIKSRKAKCKRFKCPSPAEDCCCCRILFNQLYFTNVKSLLEVSCEAHGIQIVFLPKFHCELNLIEQCWGYAKFVNYSLQFINVYACGLNGHRVLPESILKELEKENII
ncbi:hypothetical protein IW262DRAFT_1448343 [Armillaria fumosa]|nr:hypothetical protein IW262DRAFT_1448343 [Armillaria fumosa]